MRVCLIIEGAYPYVQGGMSNWVQQLMLSMPDVDFVVQTIAARRGEHRDLKYPIPPNCREIEEIYLQDDDYVGRRTQRRLRMTGRDYLALEGLVFGAQVDWDGVFRFFDRRNVSLNALLAGEDFLNMTLAYYEKNYVRVPFTDFLWSMRSMYLPLFSILKSRPMRADFYHSASGGYAGVLGSMQRSLYQKPFLMSEHGFYTREREEEIIKADWVQGVYKDLWIAQFRKIGACCYRYASRVTALYEGGRQIQIESGCPAEKTLVIPNGINPARFQSAPQKAPDDPFIHVGALLRVTPIKDVKTMIRAYALAKERCPRLKLWIMGPLDETPDYAAECMELARDLDARDVAFTGPVRPEDRIGRMDILLLSSLSEGQPLAILEGFSAKKPFIATDVGNCRGLLEGERDDWGPAGIVVPIMGVQQMADAIVRLAGDPELRRRMGEIGNRRVRRFYDQRDIMRQYRGVYGEMAREEASVWQASDSSSKKFTARRASPGL